MVVGYQRVEHPNIGISFGCEDTLEASKKTPSRLLGALEG